MSFYKLFIFIFFSIIIKTDTSTIFDKDLYDEVLNPELCEKQLDYLNTRNIGLMLQRKSLAFSWPTCDSTLELPVIPSRFV